MADRAEGGKNEGPAGNLPGRDFVFRLIEREGDIALPEKRNPSISNPLYEVVIAQEMEAHTWPDGNVSPAHEHMPGSWQWGSAGWSYSDLQTWVKFQELTAGSVGAVAKMKTKRERTARASATDKRILHGFQARMKRLRPRVRQGRLMSPEEKEEVV